MQNLFYTGLFGLSIWIAVWDFMHYKIPNALLLIGLSFYAVYIIYGMMSFQSVFPWESLLAGFLTLAIGFIFFLQGWIGAGDAKYMALAALWLYPINLFLFFIIMGLSGGLLTIIFLNFEPLWQKTRIFLIRIIKISHPPLVLPRSIPYGVAISGGIMGTILFGDMFK